MSQLPFDITATKAQKVGDIVDCFVDALGGEPSCTLRRAVVLTDIDEFNGTTQAEIIDRLGVCKSALNRDIEWLYDYGCVMRTQGIHDARAINLYTCGYAKKNLDRALEYFEGSHKDLKNFLIQFISIFGEHKPTLRDAKIASVVCDYRETDKAAVIDSLYDDTPTTETRAINNLINLGLIEKEKDKQVA